MQRFAIASDQITGDAVEVSEFPHLAVKYGVRGVPHTVINEQHAVVGARSDLELAREVLRAIGKR